MAIVAFREQERERECGEEEGKKKKRWRRERGRPASLQRKSRDGNAYAPKL